MVCLSCLLWHFITWAGLHISESRLFPLFAFTSIIPWYIGVRYVLLTLHTEFI
jgi:hypothetical protein